MFTDNGNNKLNGAVLLGVLLGQQAGGVCGNATQGPEIPQGQTALVGADATAAPHSNPGLHAMAMTAMRMARRAVRQ